MARIRNLNFPIIPPVPASQDRGRRNSWRDLIVQTGGHGDSFPEALSLTDGARALPDRDTFDVLAKRDDVPGALGVREVKFIIIDVQTSAPKLYFINTANHPLHFDFSRDVLGVSLSTFEYNRLTYFTENRTFLVGSIIVHDTYSNAAGQAGLYSIVFWPSDIVRFPDVQVAFTLLSQAMPFAQGRLAYQPGGLGQEELFERERAQYVAAGVDVVTADDVFSNVRYNPLNLGVGFGRLIVADGESPRRPTARDIPIFRQLPNDLARVAGVLSETPQTPLSHVNLRAQQNGIPNAYLRDASTNETLMPFIGKIVRFEVTPDALSVREATQAEMDRHFEGLRPARAQRPIRDFSRTEIANLDDLRHADHVFYGAKAANVAELRRAIDPARVPAGFAVPYSFYELFMRHNGLYDQIAEITSQEAFQQDEEHRRDALKDIRKTIKRAEMPDDLFQALGQMQGRFAPEITPRCRSSANAEDLVGFSGAGLYSSYTHREDEGHIEKSIKQVWASLWTFRAYEEREFYRIDHFQCAMGVLVHPNYDDERANGVAITQNPYFATFPGYYINVQIGEDRVTNPLDAAVAEELLIMSNAGLETLQPYVTMRIRESNLMPDGDAVLSVADVNLLVTQLVLVQFHFKQVYQAQNNDSFAMEVEFKVDRDGLLIIKQARPWVV